MVSKRLGKVSLHRGGILISFQTLKTTSGILHYTIKYWVKKWQKLNFNVLKEKEKKLFTVFVLLKLFIGQVGKLEYDVYEFVGTVKNCTRHDVGHVLEKKML